MKHRNATPVGRHRTTPRGPTRTKHTRNPPTVTAKPPAGREGPRSRGGFAHLWRSSWLALSLATFAGAVRADILLDVGAQVSRVDAEVANAAGSETSTSGGLHLGLGVFRPIGRRTEIGARLELDTLDSDLLLAVRAVDYRRHINDRLALGAFVGAARLDLATPAYGYYIGGGMQLKEVLPGWDLAIDLRIGDNLARDNVLPDDPQGGSPDNFYDIAGVSVYLTRRF